MSDGLLQDLGHILAASGVGAEVYEARLPIHPALIDLSKHTLPPEVLRRAMLAGGDVYELCFTAAAAQRSNLEAIGHTIGVALTRVGTIRSAPGVVVYDQTGAAISELPSGFDHFRI